MVERLRISALARIGLGPFDFIVDAGECLVINGKSGSGKSLLLRMIADLDPHEGEVWLDGRACSAIPAPDWRRQVVYCAAETGWWHPAAGDHFSHPPPLDLAAALGLTPAIFEREIRLCSTGERQRLSLLRSLAFDAPVLLLDEPTGPLDPESVGRVEAVLRARLRVGTAIILVSHDPEQAHRMATRAMKLVEGTLLAL